MARVEKFAIVEIRLGGRSDGYFVDRHRGGGGS